MKRLLLYFISASLVLGGISSCKKDKKDDATPTPSGPATGDITVQIKHKFGTADFNYGSQYTNPAFGTEDLIFTDLQYILSNFELKGKDGIWYPQPETYFYIAHATEASKTLVIKNVQVREYTDMRFMIGVDSARNVSGAQTGALDPVTGMFWSWNQGYIFFKLEGTSLAIPSPGKFTYHIGGFKYFANVRSTVNFGSKNLEVKSGSNKINLEANIAETFISPKSLSVKAAPTVTTAGTTATDIAKNYAGMYSVSSIE